MCTELFANIHYYVRQLPRPWCQRWAPIPSFLVRSHNKQFWNHWLSRLHNYRPMFCVRASDGNLKFFILTCNAVARRLEFLCAVFDGTDRYRLLLCLTKYYLHFSGSSCQKQCDLDRFWWTSPHVKSRSWISCTTAGVGLRSKLSI